MKNLLLKWAKKSLLKMVSKRLEDRKHEYITIINTRIDIPGKTEKQEEQIFRTVYDIIIDILRNI